MTNLIKISNDVIVSPEEVCSIERQIVEKYKSSSPSDESTYIEFDGSVMTLKNGRKIYVPGMLPEDILPRLQTGEVIVVNNDDEMLK